jgi:hypothetical protein
MEKPPRSRKFLNHENFGDCYIYLLIFELIFISNCDITTYQYFTSSLCVSYVIKLIKHFNYFITASFVFLDSCVFCQRSRY